MENIPEGGIDKRMNALYSYGDESNGTTYIIDSALTKEAQECDGSLET